MMKNFVEMCEEIKVKEDKDTDLFKNINYLINEYNKRIVKDVKGMYNNDIEV